MSVYLPEHATRKALPEQLNDLFICADFQNVAKLLVSRLTLETFHPQGAQIQLQHHQHIWVIQRYSMDMGQSVLCLVNFSTEQQEITLDENDVIADSKWKNISNGKEFIAGQPWQFIPHEVIWLLEES
ncbi:MAG: hypothetical protein JEZ00_12790 [Anaerolineaceae bacterium]|nr:hypothetical protein [Anaerolineaceae bacterium]